MASRFEPLPGVSRQDLARAALLGSLRDETPEGRSVVALARTVLGDELVGEDPAIAEAIPFSAERRTSGVVLADGTRILNPDSPMGRC
jgi:K+-transporting ATPase ATPase B chain